MNKKELRLFWKNKLQQIPSQRRAEASIALSVVPLPKGIIASFASFRDEINTSTLNQRLAESGSLALPRVEDGRLLFYRVQNLDAELTPSALGFLEPIPTLCKAAVHIDVILVPGLAFDREHHRLGYGKGHYDRFLASTTAVSIGVGYKEQWTEKLPSLEHDIRLNKLCLL